jgi:hypothetical protein
MARARGIERRHVLTEGLRRRSAPRGRCSLRVRVGSVRALGLLGLCHVGEHGGDVAAEQEVLRLPLLLRL